MRNNAVNVVIFIGLAVGLFFLVQQADKLLPKKDNAKPAAADEPKKNEPAKGEKDGKQPDGPKESPKVAAPAWPPPPTLLTLGALSRYANWLGAMLPPEPPTLIELGKSTFNNRALLTTRGGAVQQVVVPKFAQANTLGREVMERDADGAPTGTPVPLYLIPGVPQHRTRFVSEPYEVPQLSPGKVAHPALLAEPSFALFHYPAPDDKSPDPLLGEKNWKVVSVERPDDGEHKVVFETELGAPYFLKFRKTYTLAPGDYHIGLRIEVEKRADGKKGEGQTKLQIAGPHGLPIEGEWYTSTYRNAVIGWWDNKGNPGRQFEDAASIGVKRGGELVPRGDNKFKYMVVSTPFFASGVVVDDRAKEEQAEENPWAYVRATTELPFNKGQDPNQANFDDITVRAATEELDLAPNEKRAYSYLLYNGPAKVRLLGLMSGDRTVDPTLVERYRDKDGLQTITDYRSETALGRFVNWIGWSGLVIGCTNIMHGILAEIHGVIGSWAWSIVVLTVMVRLLLFYPSRKQTAMSMRMVELQKQLQPELEKLQEKYKDDLSGYNQEKMRLMMARGVNPLAQMGGCLLLVAQAPIMMGLYFCLQESIFFRLDHCLWINNLAAPDMLVWWGENVPVISAPENIGQFYYLGPYFNLLPLLAVGLMLYQQSKMMPPSTDPQAETQRMMMKVMMVMMALFFYKVAAGLALYFIVSTGWAIIERQFIPKPKIDLGAPKVDANGKPPSNLSPAAAAALAAEQQKNRGFLGRLRDALEKRMEEVRKQADEQSRRQIRNDPNRPGGSTPGPNGTSPAPGTGPANQNRRNHDKKKRRRK
jgi:YidC/Oxa1 family membrane protein insertase